MPKTEIKVYKLLKEDNYIGTNILAKKIGKSEKTIYRAIKRLKDLGMIVRVGDDYSGYWKVL